MPRFTANFLTFILVISFSSDAFAWDYLEHAWFADVSCSEAQRVLADAVSDDPELASRYVALSLMCPMQWDRPYCAAGNKTARGAVNVVQSEDDSAYSITLGDYSALGDHYTRYGPIEGFPRALDDGLIARTYEWLVRPQATAGGLIEDVAEDACETDSADFRGARADVVAAIQRVRSTGDHPDVPARLLFPGVRVDPLKGPSDPTAVYSFNNPHYLDMVVRNHIHFGEPAFSSWVGFHSAALQIATRRCEDVVPTDASLLEDLSDARGLAIDWDAIRGRARAEKACEFLGNAIRDRVKWWGDHAPAEVLDPVREYIATMDASQSQSVLVALVSLVMEGSGLHFLQDGLASGHMRTIRSRESLSEVRHDHDHDNEQGVVAHLQTRQSTHHFFAYGDTYLLSRSRVPGCVLDWRTMANATYLIPEVVTACTIQHQRGILAAAGSASLVDWALSGPSFKPLPGKGCAPIDSPEGWVCRMLPTSATMVSGQEHDAPSMLTYGNLPVPPPKYSYESLSFRVGLELEGNSPQIGLVLSFLDELGSESHWMTNWRFGLTTTLGNGDDNEWIIDASYHFHYRLSARFMIDLGPFWYVGLRDLDEDVELTAGIGPSVGFTALPEGWINIPLELGVTYQVPLTFFASKSGFFADTVADDHWLQFGIGLAFSH